MIRISALIMVMSLMTLVVGCDSRQQYGNFTKVDSQSLVNDAVAMMLATYPPAQTRLNMLHEPKDDWGSKLVRVLRTHGYAVAEYNAKPAEKDKYSQSGVGLAFILNEYKPDKEYNLTLFIGNDIVSRSYALRGADDSKIFVGLGQWSRRR